MKNVFLVLALLFSGHSFAALAYSHGSVDIVESFPDKVVVRWDGPNSQSCGEDDVILTVDSMGSAEAFNRAFTLALTATASGKTIRFRLDGCSASSNSTLQRATAAQLCGKPDCSY